MNKPTYQSSEHELESRVIPKRHKNSSSDFSSNEPNEEIDLYKLLSPGPSHQKLMTKPLRLIQKPEIRLIAPDNESEMFSTAFLAASSSAA